MFLEELNEMLKKLAETSNPTSGNTTRTRINRS